MFSLLAFVQPAVEQCGGAVVKACLTSWCVAVSGMKVDRAGAVVELYTAAYYSCLPTTHPLWQQAADMSK